MNTYIHMLALKTIVAQVIILFCWSLCDNKFTVLVFLLNLHTLKLFFVLWFSLTNLIHNSSPPYVKEFSRIL